jgi:hypothetical protein
MRMDEHTRGTLRFWREATPTHDIKFAAGKLQTPSTMDRSARKRTKPWTRDVMVFLLVPENSLSTQRSSGRFVPQFYLQVIKSGIRKALCAVSCPVPPDAAKHRDQKCANWNGKQQADGRPERQVYRRRRIRFTFW